MTRLAICMACVLVCLVCFPARPQTVGTPPLPINPGSLIPSNPLPPIITPDRSSRRGQIGAPASPDCHAPRGWVCTSPRLAMDFASDRRRAVPVVIPGDDGRFFGERASV